MAEASKAGEQDQSMEEILQSIKRIIAEEGDVAPGKPQTASPTPFESDVLELTDIVEDIAAPVDSAHSAFVDPLDAIFAAPTDGGFQAPAFATWEDEPALDTASQVPAESVEKAPIAILPVEGVMSSDDDSLLSEISVAASANALRALKGTAEHAPLQPQISSPAFRSGMTVEDLVVESLRPMLKEWLDSNLPQLVERKVQREIERITRAMQD